MFNVLIVGAGFSGAVIARELAEVGCKITVIDKRNHIAGNAYDYTDENGIKIHQYGPHIFHTNNDKVIEYVKKYDEWVEYFHKVKAILSDGQYVTLPVNKETSEIVGEDKIVETFIRPYSEKMWGMKLEDIDKSVLNRVPIRNDNNDLYFPNDKFQGFPKNGYTSLIKNILNHKNIEIKLNYSFKKEDEQYYDKIFNSMSIDEYFDFKFGKLEYRSIKFHNVEIPSPKLLPVACVNFTHTGKFTRMTEWKNFLNHGTNDKITKITYEEPCNFSDNNDERYYPVKDINGTNKALLKKYQELIPDNMEFIGRCGLYVYLDMDKIIALSLKISNDFISKRCNTI